jgi:hypothetical protein
MHRTHGNTWGAFSHESSYYQVHMLLTNYFDIGTVLGSAKIESIVGSFLTVLLFLQVPGTLLVPYQLLSFVEMSELVGLGSFSSQAG